MSPDLDAIAALKQLNVTELYKELVAFTIFECRTYGWCGADSYEYIHEKTALAAGNSPEDIVSKVIEDTIDGPRKWNKEKYPNIKHHFKWVIRSVVNNLANHSENKTQIIANVSAASWKDDFSEENDLSDEKKGLLGKVLEYDAVESQEFMDAIIDEFDGDKMLEAVLDDVMSGLKPEEIALKLNLPISQIYQLTRKIVRKVKKVVQNTSKVTGGGYAEPKN